MMRYICREAIHLRRLVKQGFPVGVTASLATELETAIQDEHRRALFSSRGGP